LAEALGQSLLRPGIDVLGHAVGADGLGDDDDVALDERAQSRGMPLLLIARPTASPVP
jgi:hypothetical protein